MTSRSGATRAWVVVLAVAALFGALLTVPVPDAASAPPDPASGQLAFTDGVDSLVQRELSTPTFSGPLTPQGSVGLVPDAQGRHNGEASSPGDRSEGAYAFVSSRPTSGSTEDDVDGEVYYFSTGDVASVNATIQVTDDDAVQTSPAPFVVSKDCSDGGSEVLIAYASDEAGNFDIYVARLIQDPAAPSSGCEQLVVDEVVQVTTDPGDDLWPSWSADGRLVFSSTRSDPLGDLYAIEPFPSGGQQPIDTLVQLTDHPGEDSMPAVRGVLEVQQICAEDLDGNEPTWVAYRTTEYDPRGGLAVLDLDDPGSGPLDLGVDQAAEPAWAEFGINLAYTSYADDPDGDIEVGRFVRTCPDADLAVDVVIAAAPVFVGDTIDVEITVSNGGPQTSTGTTLTAVAPAEITLTTGNTACFTTAGCAIADLEPGGSTTLDFEFDATTDTGGDAVEVSAVVEADPPDPNESNNTDAESFDIGPEPVDLAAALFTSTAIGGEFPGVEFGTPPFDTVTVTDGSTVTVFPRIERLSGSPSASTVTLTVTTGSAFVEIDESGCGSTTCTKPLSSFSGDFAFLSEGFVLRGVDETSPGQASVRVIVTPESGRADSDPTNNENDYPVAVQAPPPPPPPPIPLAAGPVHLLTSVVGSAATIVGLAPAVLPADVPPAVKPAVDDTVALEDVAVVFGEYGQAESHPTFSQGLLSGDDEFITEITATVRVRTADVSAVLADDGTDRQVLAELELLERHPAYSPDGTQVAYHREVECPAGQQCPPSTEIVVADADGANPVAVFTDRQDSDLDSNPAWSPDGSQIAFTKRRDDEPASIWVTNLTDTANPVTTPEVAEDFGDISEFDDEATWSPDGTQIAFTRARCDTTGIDSDGDGVPDTARDDCGTPPPEPPPPPPAPPPPAVPIPPDEFPRDAQHDSDIWIVDVGTGDEAPLLDVEVAAPLAPLDPVDPGVPCEEDDVTVCTGGDDRGADWSPDGELIVYEHTGWLWLATSGGDDEGPITGPRALTQGPFTADEEPLYPDDPLDGPPSGPNDPAEDFYPELSRAQDPAWSPNGDRIAFAGQPRGQPDLLGVFWLTYVPADPDARQILEVAQLPQPELEPDWQPTADLALTLGATPAAVQVGNGSTVTAEVVNEGPSTAIDAVVELTLPAGLIAGSLPAGCSAGPPLTCDLGDMADGDSVARAIPVTTAALGNQIIDGETSSSTVDPDLADNTASTSIVVSAVPVEPLVADVSVEIEVDPNPAYVAVDDDGDPILDGGNPAGDGHEVTITARNDGPDPSTVTLSVSVPAAAGPPGDPCLTVAGCTLGVIAPSADVVTTIQLDPELPYVGTATAEVTGSETDPDLTNNTDTVGLEALAPRLLLLPDLGPPGFVTLAVGQDFPPAADVDLDWDPGLEASTNERTVQANGTFSLQVVVLHRDRLGERGIRASTDDLPFDVTTDFLVVPRTQAPPEFEGRG